MRIGEAARRVGVATHVLRHWEEVGVVVPDRSAAGHRDYTDEHLHRLRILRACQGVGMPLAEIRLLLHRDEPGRTTVIERHLCAIQGRQAQLAAAERFLTHVVDCRHDLVTRCPECSAYGDPATPVDG
ncbi:MerR family transcriptional regulator [Mycolicibacterium palauense]|uniref:MerR family transcriptional regulator n=1 Tax=Mycolicibacterium palauense TaxID=2034511 RepID=UPI000BFED096|nr:MerR family transcriptional regulator [Mycolicibacterium palauense]